MKPSTCLNYWVTESHQDQKIIELERALENCEREVLEAEKSEKAMVNGIEDFATSMTNYSQMIAKMEKEILLQQNIASDYRTKLTTLKLDFETITSHFSHNQGKVDSRLTAIEENLLRVAKEQRELFCLMMLGKGTSLDHNQMLERVYNLKTKELRELIEARFFPNTKREINTKLIAEKRLNDRPVELNISSVLVALEKVKEKFHEKGF